MYIMGDEFQKISSVHSVPLCAPPSVAACVPKIYRSVAQKHDDLPSISVSLVNVVRPKLIENRSSRVSMEEIQRLFQEFLDSRLKVVDCVRDAPLVAGT